MRKAAELAPELRPAILSAPQRLSPSSFNSSNSYPGYPSQSTPSYGTASSHSSVFPQSAFGSGYGYSDSQQPPHATNLQYHTSNPQTRQQQPQSAQPLYQQPSYFPEVRRPYESSSASTFAYQNGDAPVLSPRSYFTNAIAHVQAFDSNHANLRWSPSQPHFFGQEGQNGSLSVSPVSSHASSNDEAMPQQRRRSMVPPGLSNLSGLSIKPSTTMDAPIGMSYMSGNSTTGPSVSAPAAPYLFSEDSLGLSHYQVPPPLAYATSMTGQSAPMLSPTTLALPMGAPTSAAFGPDFTNGTTFPLQSYASTVPGGPLTDPLPLSTALQPSLFAHPQQQTAPMSLQNTDTVLQMSANLAARRQSMTSYPEQRGSFALQPIQSRHEALASVPRAFKLLDEAGLPQRRASTSALNSSDNAHDNVPLHRQHRGTQPQVHSSLVAGRHQPLDGGASAMRRPSLASPPASWEPNHHDHQGVTSSPVGASSGKNASSLDNMHILGGLRRGSIAKKAKSPSSSYTPYPQPHVRNAPNTSTSTKNFDNTQ